VSGVIESFQETVARLNRRSFSGRHEQSYDSQTALTQQFVEGFAKAERYLPEGDYEKYLEMKDGCVFSP